MKRETLRKLWANRTFIGLGMLGAAFGCVFAYLVSNHAEHGLSNIGTDDVEAITYVGRLRDWAIAPLLIGAFFMWLGVYKGILRYISTLLASLGLALGLMLLSGSCVIDMFIPSGSHGYWATDPEMQEWERNMEHLEQEMERNSDGAQQRPPSGR